MTHAQQIAELLLSAMYKDPQRGLTHAFFFGKPGQKHATGFGGGGGTSLHYDRASITEAALAYRQNGPPYLRYLPLGEVESLLHGFVAQYYGILAKETFLTQFKVSYAEAVSQQTKNEFAAAMAASDLFHPPKSVALFPISPIHIAAPFDGQAFFFCAPADLSTTRLGVPLPEGYLKAEQFPPTADFKGRPKAVASWLGVRLPDRRAARKWRSAILGAAALCPFYRHMFTGREIVEGTCQFQVGQGVSYSFQGQHTPALGDDLCLTPVDHDWLAMMDELLLATDDQSRRYVRALEYFYRAWPKDQSERFPLMFMTLDAVFGEKNNATQIVIDSIRALLGSHISDERLRRLMDMRASVIHGGSPDIYDSDKYPKYIRKYDADPISDLEDVVAACMRKRIFSDRLQRHEDPNKELMMKLISEGKFPADYETPSILDAPQALTS